MIRLPALLLLVAAVLIAGCLRHTGYKGDGRFTDNGVLAYSSRYGVDLGPITLVAGESKRFVLAGLPRAEFTIGLHTHRDNEVAIARITLQSADGAVIVSESGALTTWTAMTGRGDSHAYYYRRGEHREIVLPSGDTRSEPINVKPSGGRGTYFHSARRETYTLTVDILGASAQADAVATIRLNGWGRR